MAIGIARILGFKLPKNFDMPYISQSITEFWRRWHLTLSFWLRDYLYISLGGNRNGEWHTKINLMLTMLLGGLWHGASWNFVLWGGMHGVGLIIHKIWLSWKHPIKNTIIYQYFAWGLTLTYVILLWVPFRSPDWQTTMLYYERIFSGATGISWMHTGSFIVLSAVSIWHIMYLRNNEWLVSFPSKNVLVTNKIYPILAVLMLILLFAPMETSPFIYFQF